LTSLKGEKPFSRALLADDEPLLPACAKEMRAVSRLLSTSALNLARSSVIGEPEVKLLARNLSDIGIVRARRIVQLSARQ